MSDQSAEKDAIRAEVKDVLGYYGADEFFNTTTGRSEHLPERDELIERLVEITTTRLPMPTDDAKARAIAKEVAAEASLRDEMARESATEESDEQRRQHYIRSFDEVYMSREERGY